MLRTYWNWKHLQRAASEYILFTSSETTPAYLPEYRYHWLAGEAPCMLGTVFSTANRWLKVRTVPYRQRFDVRKETTNPTGV
jgi:hypothetical protein